MTSESVWIGADPGGKGKFGVALLEGQVVTKAAVDCADDAVAFIRGHLDGRPAGVGVDAPLWFASGPSGDRHADQWLRKRYGFTWGQVQAANSLRGAALSQGAMFVQRVREVYAEVPVTETHPKALLKALTGGDWSAFARRFQVDVALTGEDERDAIVSAVAARESFEERWTHDLSATRLPSEQDPKAYWLAPVQYCWPER